MTRLTFHLIAHTHWDREWYLPRGQFGARLIRVIDDLVDFLEQQPAVPGFLLDGQTVLLEDYLRVRPDQHPRVSRLVSQGRIETGPWYVLADEQIPSGESLIRNLQLGAADCASLGGGMRVLYSPDAFGHPAILPTIAAEFGLEYGAAWRGITSQADLFHWRGADGARVLMYHFPPDGYEIGSGLSSNPENAKPAWQAVRRTVIERAASSQIAVFVGADHHASRSDLSQLRETIAALEPQHDVRLSRLADYFAALDNLTSLSTVQGELRHHGHTWTLQGVHGTRAHQKRRNSRLEIWLERYAEPLAALSGWKTGRNQRPRLDWAWRTLVQCQFHDAIGGCAGDAVAQEVDVRLTEVEGIARETVRESLQQLSAWDPDRARNHPEDVKPSLLIWNPAARPREGIVLAQVTRFRKDILVGPPGNRVPRTAEPEARVALRTSSGEEIPVQVLGRHAALERLDAAHHYPDQDEVELIRIAFEAPVVAGLSGETLTLVPGQEMPQWGGAEAVGRRLSNEHLSVEVGRDGSLSVLDRRSGPLGQAVLRLESERDSGDTYTVSPARPPRLRRLRGPVRVRVLAPGPIVAALEVVGKIEIPAEEGRPAGIIHTNLLVMLFRDEPFVRCSLRLDNQAKDHRLRARFSTGASSTRTIAGAQFGVEERRVVTDRPHIRETPVATAPAHRFVGIPGDSGLSVFAPGFFEYELEPGGDLLITILRAIGQLSRQDLPTRPGHAGWPTPTPLAQCIGPDALDFAFIPGSEGVTPAQLQESWEQLFLPLRAGWFRDWNGKVELSSGMELEGEGLALSAVMPARRGEGIVFRCFNLLDQPSEGRLSFEFPVSRVERIRADETVLADITSSLSGRTITFTARALELVSLRVS